MAVLPASRNGIPPLSRRGENEGCEELSPLSKGHFSLQEDAPFKKLFENDEVATLLPVMERHAKLYVLIVLPGRTSGNNRIDRRLADIRAIGATTAYSSVLALMESWDAGRMTDDELDGSLGLLLPAFFAGASLG